MASAPTTLTKSIRPLCGVADRDLQALLGRQPALEHLVAGHADADDVVGADPAPDLLEHLQA